MRKLSLLSLALLLTTVQIYSTGGGKRGGGLSLHLASSPNGGVSGGCLHPAEQEIVGSYKESPLLRGDLRTTWEELEGIMHDRPSDLVGLWSNAREVAPSYCPLWGGDSEKVFGKYLEHPSASSLYVLHKCISLEGSKALERRLEMVYPPELIDSNNLADGNRYTRRTTSVLELPGYQNPEAWGNSVRSAWGKRDAVVALYQYKKVLESYEELRTDGAEINEAFNGILASEFTSEGYCRERDSETEQFHKLPHEVKKDHAERLVKLRLAEEEGNDGTHVTMHDGVLNILAHTHYPAIQVLCRTMKKVAVEQDAEEE
ncbi:MAG TPA: hypothetical protein QGF02_04565 [Candidatus Babeliales bacterium]|nr:hypothetical protein [Candidatus Babeliales bacterium]